MKRGFGDNRDGSILRDGVRSVQARNFTPTTERVEVLKAGLDAVRHGRAGRDDQHDHQKPQLQQHTHVKAGAAASTAAAASLTLPGRSARRGLPIA